MAGHSYDTVFYNLTSSFAAIASAIAIIRSRRTSKKVRTAIEGCEDAKEKLRRKLRDTQEDRDTLRIRNSALQTEIVFLRRLLPGGDIAKKLGLEEWSKHDPSGE